MPSVNIREKDFTGSEAQSYLDYTVLIPAIDVSCDGDNINGLYVKVKELVDAVDRVVTKKCASGDEKQEYLDKVYSDKGFIMAYQLLKQGLSVQYAGIYDENSDFINDEDGEEITADKFYKEYEDKGKYDLRFITTGAIESNVVESEDEDVEAKEANLDFYNAALKCAGNRGDAIAVLNVPEKGLIEAEDEEGEVVLVVKNLTKSTVIDAWVQEHFGTLANEPILREGVSWTDVTETYGRYGAMFCPVINVKLTTEGNTRLESMPATFDYLAAFAKQIANGIKPWFATAGSSRGVGPYLNIVPTVKFGDSDINVLQVRSNDENLGHVATDVVCEIKPFGNVLWGNRTMHPLARPINEDGSSDGAVQLTASSFLNIRQLCCSIKKVLYRACRKYTFEPNSDTLWINFRNAISPILDEAKANQGIRAYKIVRENTNSKALVVARIKIVPIEAVEDFDLTVELSDSIEVTE